MQADLLIRGGRLIDPLTGFDGVTDLAVRDGTIIARGADAAPMGAALTLHAHGKLVLPGFIDLHVHVFPGVSYLGIDADQHLLAHGVTTAVDAGSAGATTYEGFRRFVIEASATRLYAMLNIARQGMLDAAIGEFDDMRYSTVADALKMIERNRETILGIKVRLTRDVIASRAAGLRPLHLAREAADAAGLPIMVHPQEAWCDSIDDVLALMRGGDIMTHCFHGSSHGIFDDDGRLRPAVLAAAERGVLFDVGHGAGSFSWQVAERALQQGFAPQTISSDLHVYNVNGPVFDLATTAAKFLQLGMPLPEVIRRITANPAVAVGRPADLGTLQVGAVADIVVAELVNGAFAMFDSHSEQRIAEQMLVPRTVIRAGRIVDLPISHDHGDNHQHAHLHHH
jgi:dihydroorotase